MSTKDQFLKGQVCLVTGGAQGIGWAITMALADHGARVYACDVVMDNVMRADLETRTLPFGENIKVSQCDVTNRAVFREWIMNIYKETGRIDILVNNAMYTRWQDVTETPVEDAERMMQTAYNAMVYGVSTVLPLMLRARRGWIINMGSSAGRIFVGSASASYAAAKAAIDGYSQTLAVELRNSPLKVILVRPATVAGTDFFRKNVSSERLPRLNDFVGYVTPPQIADSIIRAIRHGRHIVNVPRFLPVLYFFFTLSPGLFRWLAAQGGKGRRRYDKIQWQYKPKG